MHVIAAHQLHHPNHHLHISQASVNILQVTPVKLQATCTSSGVAALDFTAVVRPCSKPSRMSVSRDRQQQDVLAENKPQHFLLPQPAGTEVSMTG